MPSIYWFRNPWLVKNNEEVTNSLAFGACLWGKCSSNLSIADQNKGFSTVGLTGVYPKKTIDKLDGNEIIDVRFEQSRCPSSLFNKAQNSIWANRVNGTAISSYTSLGCFNFNDAMSTLPKWIFKKPKKDSYAVLQDSFTVMLKTSEQLSDNEFKAYLKRISKQAVMFMDDQNRVIIKESTKYSVQNIDTMIKNALQHLTITPALVALLYCACVPQGDRMCNEIYCNDIMRCFPEEAAMFSKEIEYHLTQSQMFNTKGILDLNGGKTSVERVKQVALVAIGPTVYVNLHCVRKEYDRLKQGDINLKTFKNKIRYTDRYGKNASFYMTTEDKFIYHWDGWINQGIKIGYFVSRFGYDIAGEVLGVERPSGTCLDLDDDFNLKHQEMITKFDEEFNVYDQDGYMESSTDAHFYFKQPFCSLGDNNIGLSIAAIGGALTILGLVANVLDAI